MSRKATKDVLPDAETALRQLLANAGTDAERARLASLLQPAGSLAPARPDRDLPTDLPPLVRTDQRQSGDLPGGRTEGETGGVGGSDRGAEEGSGGAGEWVLA